MTPSRIRLTPISADARYDRDWLAVAAAGVGMIFSVGTLTLYPFGVFMGPVGHDLGWTRGQMSGAVTFSQVFLVIGSLCWGALLDRFGPRRTLLPAIVGLGTGLALLGMLSRPLWHLYAMFALIPILAAAANPLGYAGVLVRRFNHNLGLALGLALMGVGLGAALIPPAAQHLIARFGWRLAYAILGAITIAIAIPAAIVATWHASGPALENTAKDRPPVLPLLASRTFLLICATFFLLGTAGTGVLTHFVPMLTDRGYAPANAARMAALIGIATLVSRGVIGWLLDRFHAPYLVAIIALLFSAACLMLVYGRAPAWNFVVAILLGFVGGAEVDFITFLVRKYFGQAAFGRLYGIAFAAFVIGPGTLLIGVSFDHFHRYGPGLLLFVALSVFAAILALMLPRYDQQRINLSR